VRVCVLCVRACCVLYAHVVCVLTVLSARERARVHVYARNMCVCMRLFCVRVRVPVFMRECGHASVRVSRHARVPIIAALHSLHVRVGPAWSVARVVQWQKPTCRLGLLC
jgi:hypothetical protein